MDSALKPSIYKIIVKEEKSKELKEEGLLIEHNPISCVEDEGEITIYIEAQQQPLNDQDITKSNHIGTLRTVLCDEYTKNLYSDDAQNFYTDDLDSTIHNYTEDYSENINNQENTVTHFSKKIRHVYTNKCETELKPPILEDAKVEDVTSFIQNDSNVSYYCNICNKILSSENELNDHWRSQHSSSFKCRECDLILTSQEQLKTHLETHNFGDNVDKSFTCTVCQCSFSKQASLQKHISIHNQELLPNSNVCIQCGVNFESKVLLEKHLKTHKEDPSEIYACYECDVTFDNHSSFSQHEHNILRIRYSEHKEYACNICDYIASSKKNLYRHMWSHSQHNIPIFSCDICEKKFSGIMLKRHKLMHKYNNSLTCKECGEKFQDFMKLDKHMKAHASNDISCIFCDSTFQSRAEYNKHMEFIHIDKYGTVSPNVDVVPNYCTCRICFKIFPQRSGLNEHMKIHLEEKKCPKCDYTSKIKAQLEIHIASQCETVQAFKCKECGKQFSSEPFLKRHKIIHSAKKPYECTECNFKSSHSQSLRSHLRKVHNKRDEDIYTFPCSKCEKKFASMGEVQLHLKLKRCEFKCPHCNFMCKLSKDMKKHRKYRHYTKRNIACPECPRTFQSNWQLEKHITAIHDGEKLYLCGQCNKSFGFKASLQKHLKTIHDDITYSCEECDFKTTTEHNLEVHIVRKHGDMQLFPCSYCDFKCTSPYILKKHITAKHPDEDYDNKKLMNKNIFQCPNCDKPFANRAKLKEHYISEHL
ncbi:unnamed protein product [Meganyctiphanes norvegica]|uniref:C2H2-type domain-containing protein n=1 Tax=Meganyctiphanes norvegica TaxID=48144 RepID=A0AAV2RAY2_MEGNR